MRLLLTLASLAAVVGVAATSATAGTSPTPSNSSCSFPSQSQVFSPFGDSRAYFLAPGANFEGSIGGWTLGGGAAFATGNETSYVGSSTDSHSLALPTTSASATTPTFCVTSNAPTFRMFIQNHGNLGHIDGQLAVYLNYAGADGETQQVKIAALTVKSTNWTLSPSISFIQYISTPLQSGYANISFTIKPNDNHGNRRIDDLYVDPYCSR